MTSLLSALSGSPDGFGTNTPEGRKQGVRLAPTWTALRHRGSGAAVDADTLAIGDEAVASGVPGRVAAARPGRQRRTRRSGRLLRRRSGRLGSSEAAPTSASHRTPAPPARRRARGRSYRPPREPRWSATSEGQGAPRCLRSRLSADARADEKLAGCRLALHPCRHVDGVTEGREIDHRAADGGMDEARITAIGLALIAVLAMGGPLRAGRGAPNGSARVGKPGA